GHRRPGQGGAGDRPGTGHPGPGDPPCRARPADRRRGPPGAGDPGPAVRVPPSRRPARRRTARDPAHRRPRRHHRPAQPRRGDPLGRRVRRPRGGRARAPVGRHDRRRVEDLRRRGRPDPGGPGHQPHPGARGLPQGGLLRRRARRRRRGRPARAQPRRPAARRRRRVGGQGPVPPGPRDLRPDRLHPDELGHRVAQRRDRRGRRALRDRPAARTAVTRRPVAAVAAPLLGMTLLAACSSGPPEGGTGEGVTDTAPATPGRHQPVATLDVPETDLDVVAVYPRPGGFTQGLELLDDGRVLHSTGRYGESQIRVEELGGDVVTSRDLPDEHFGEGVTVVDGTAYQLTWQEEVVHTWSLPDLEPGPTYEIGTEGW